MASEQRIAGRSAPSGGLRVAIALVIVAAALAVASPASATPGSLSVTTLGETVTPTMLAEDLAGAGVTVSNVTYTGNPVAAGRFADSGTDPDLIVGFGGGVILSSGAAAAVPGPNQDDATSVTNEAPGNETLSTIAGASTFDAATLAFDFTPDADTITFRYVFASEEYNEYVGQGFDDVFAFLINGSNCATVATERVSVDTVNGGNPFGTTDPQLGVIANHPELFRNNDPDDPGPPTINTEMDGLTTVLTCTAVVTANSSNSMWLSIADVSDFALDSNVFIEAGSLTTEPPIPDEEPGAPTDVIAAPGDGAAIVSWDAPTDDGGAPIDQYEVTCVGTQNVDDVHVVTTDGGTTSTPISGLTNGTEYSCTVRAHNSVGFGPPSDPSAPFTPVEAGAQFSMILDTSVGGILLLNPEGPDNAGTTGKIKIPPQPGPATDVVVTASLFGVPGETDATCGGNVCIGQGIEWSVSDPSAIKKMRVKFIEAPFLTHGGSAQDAIAYKDGAPVADCPTGVPDRDKPKPCVVWRYTSKGGLWQITLLVDGSDPKGRI